ncbi:MULTISPECIES: M16 family metallopeptidase [Oceanobacillus]|uniref:Peptidase M16 n=1 Tax=Oceanobacillus indicireducens TaxID=1004261 RepID=A0A918CYQ8_9BACI|nr:MULTISPECIES: pitrilysin family protein [Oceanobacillus]GGN49987.1 peptidase M16 [Oceanobacillus indicireducens]
MIQKHQSKNGLRIVLEPIPAVRSVTIGIWVLTGSRNETVENNGISHFIEHMLFKGTKTRTARDIAEAFDSIGGQINAFTSKEYTCFYAKVLDTHKELALEILADMFFDSSFDEEEMEREKKVVYEEIKMYEDTPDDIVHDFLAQAAFGNHPLGFPIIGSEKQLESFHPAMLRDYMNEQYTPENIVISIAGNADESFVQLIDDRFGSFTRPGKKKEEMTALFVGDSITKNKDTEQAHLCLGYRGLPINDSSTYSLILLNNVLGGSMSSRLFQDVRESQGLAYSVFSYHASFLEDGLLTIYAGTGNEQLTKLQETIDDTIAELVDNGITDKELHNSKEQLKGNLVLSLESTSSRMSRNGRNELLLKRHRSIDEIIKEIDAISHSSVRNVIDHVFKSKPAIAIISNNN